MWHPHPDISSGIDACGNCTLNISVWTILAPVSRPSYPASMAAASEHILKPRWSGAGRSIVLPVETV
jgi:hypothetical protein